jgi:hypothetical protein
MIVIHKTFISYFHPSLCVVLFRRAVTGSITCINAAAIRSGMPWRVTGFARFRIIGRARAHAFAAFKPGPYAFLRTRPLDDHYSMPENRVGGIGWKDE